MTTITRRACWTFVLALAVHASAAAQTTAAPPAVTFAVLSLVGDEFTVVTRKDEVGSRLDQNTRRSYKVDTSILDEYALDAAEKTIAKLKPGASVLRFSIRDPRLFELQDRLLADSGDSRGMREALAKLAREHKANRLVIVTKWRDEASFKAWHRSHLYHDAHRAIPKGLKLVPKSANLRCFELVCT